MPTCGKTITKKEVINTMEFWKEETTASPSGRHLGHYKMLLKPHSTTEEGNISSDIHDKQEKIIQAHVDLTNYAIKNK